MAKFGKKRFTDHDFPPPFIECGVGKKNKKSSSSYCFEKFIRTALTTQMKLGYFKSAPKLEFNKEGSKVFGSTVAKNRFTFLLMMNETRTDKELFVTGKYGNPRYVKFRNVPVPYFHNKKGRMTSEIWQKILICFDAILFCDNSTCPEILD